MGRLSTVPSVDCLRCGAEVDERYRHKHVHPHKCLREDIDWDEAPDTSRSAEFIAWNGTCEACGRRVYECYVPRGPLYDLATDRRV